MPERSVRRSVSYEELNDALIRAVPDSAKTILEIGCAQGQLGDCLKQLDPERIVYGIERDPDAAEAARRVLDAVFEINIEESDAPVELGTIDCIVYNDVLERLVDPWSVLRRHRSLLSANGSVLCSIPNSQHHSVVTQILRGDLQYQDVGQLDKTHLRFFTFATAIKMLLDAGYEPDLIGSVDAAADDELIEAAMPLFETLRANPARSARYLDMYQMILSGRPLPEPDRTSEVPLTFVVCVNDEAQLEANLLRSPCLRAPSPHQVLLFRGCRSAAEGLNAGIAQAVNDLVVLVHQDVYLPEGWTARLAEEWREAERVGGPIGIGGIFGMESRQESGSFVGHVVDRDHLLARGDGRYPKDIDILDEVLLVVRRDTPARFDPALGWHLYGVDLCLSERRRGNRVVLLDALCHHNSLPSAEVDSAYRASEDVMAQKWSELLPICTPCSVIESGSVTWRIARLEEQLEHLVQQLDEARSGAVTAQEENDRQRIDTAAALEETVRLLDEAKLQISSMEASPFWRARQSYAGVRGRLLRRS